MKIAQMEPVEGRGGVATETWPHTAMDVQGMDHCRASSTQNVGTSVGCALDCLAQWGYCNLALWWRQEGWHCIYNCRAGGDSILYFELQQLTRSFAIARYNTNLVIFSSETEIIRYKHKTKFQSYITFPRNNPKILRWKLKYLNNFLINFV